MGVWSIIYRIADVLDGKKSLSRAFVTAGSSAQKSTDFIQLIENKYRKKYPDCMIIFVMHDVQKDDLYKLRCLNENGYETLLTAKEVSKDSLRTKIKSLFCDNSGSIVGEMNGVRKCTKNRLKKIRIDGNYCAARDIKYTPWNHEISLRQNETSVLTH